MAESTHKVRCNRIVHFRSRTGEDKKHPVVSGFMNINATSGNSRWSGLSPMKLGPFTVVEKLAPNQWYPDGVHPGFVKNGDLQSITCLNFENYWLIHNMNKFILFFREVRRLIFILTIREIFSHRSF